MRVTSVYPTKTFKLVLEFNHGEYRLFDIRKIPTDPKGLVADIQHDRELFLTAEIDSIAGTVRWENGVDFDPQMLYEQSVSLDRLTDIHDYIQIKENTPVTKGIRLLKQHIVAFRELIENYEYYLKQNISEEEREETIKEIKELKSKILSYQQSVLVLEGYQKENTHE
ncbi:DUF2442 domain-containing protein [Peribacillus tepidiphilus]|jgi:hypothetical protein|uniref:DUF2442 domain-containing protein n=1 Tax=Peribacillus tepidiphilus TaxID=2652445 RepID=UPI0012917E04|nr:DUF2442 domain-containing protein [Peribacillus tepidiphilus]